MPGRISRGRGYAWEHYLDGFINNLRYWHCRRLGGSSANMPDLLLVNNEKSIIIATECKSMMTDNPNTWIYVPHDQIKRCITMVEIFELYRHKEVVLSFKFGRGYKRVYFHTVYPQLWNIIVDAESVITSCDIYGKCKITINSPNKFKGTVFLKKRVSLIDG